MAVRRRGLASLIDLSRLEGIIPALESAHAVAYGMKLAKELGPQAQIIINISGRGDKDVAEVAAVLERKGVVL